MREEIAEAAVEQARRAGATYAEARMEDSFTETISARDGALESMERTEDNGWGVRVLVGGGWGFASTTRSDSHAVRDLVAAAVEIAHASATVRKSPSLFYASDFDPAPSAEVAEYASPVQRDPATVPLSEKVALVLDACNEASKGAHVNTANAHLYSREQRKYFVSSNGLRLRQRLTSTGGGVAAHARAEGASYHRSFDNYHQAGFEYVESLNLRAVAQRVGAEAGALVVAPWVEDRRTTVVLGSQMLSLLCHESCGHPIELDRVLGAETAFAGTSFLTTDKLGGFQYGSPHVNLTADATLAEGLGTFGWDDEGVTAQNLPIVRAGNFVGYLSSRDTAPAIGRSSGGCARADGWGRMPMVRMTNVSLEAGPGDTTLADLIAQVDDGYYLDTPSSWSLDDKRLNFNFSTELCYEIKNGKLGELRKGASFSELTPTFWGNCQAVAGLGEWQLWGFLGCAKGEPIQSAAVSHGASPALFTNLNVVKGGK